jgi:hypothetical protein
LPTVPEPRFTIKLSFASLEEAEDFFEEVRHDHLDAELGLRLQEVADVPASPAEETPLIVTGSAGNSPWVVRPIAPAAAAGEEGR